MNSQNKFLNAQFGDAYIFPPNVEYAAEQQTQQQNTQYQVNNHIYSPPPQIENQTIEQVYQPNIEYPVDQRTNQSNTENQVNNQFYQSNADWNMESKPSTSSTSLPQKVKGKRNRTKYTEEQIKYLEENFKMHPYITLKKKKELAATLGMEEQQIKKWYQNRRMKESTKRKANYQEDNENQRLPNPSIGNAGLHDHQINLNLMNSIRYNNIVYPEATSQGVYANRTQYLSKPKEDNPMWNLQNPNHYYAYNNPNVYTNNLNQNTGVILPTLPVNFHPAPLQQNYQNMFNNYYSGNNSNENLIPNFSMIPYPPLESINPLQFQEGQDIFTDNVLPYNEDEQN